MVLFFNMLDIAAVNAFIVWSEISPNYHANKSHRRRIFLEEVGKALIAEEIEVIQRGPNRDSTKRKRCQLCSRENDRKTSIKCSRCEKFICPGHAKNICVGCSDD